MGPAAGAEAAGRVGEGGRERGERQRKRDGRKDTEVGDINTDADRGA
jgi:hypothetical protein